MQLPGPIEPGSVNSQLSDRELFARALQEGWQNELEDVPWLGIPGSGLKG